MPSDESSNHKMTTNLCDIALIDELPRDCWTLGSAIRPNGDALITRLNGPEVYSLRKPASRSTRSNQKLVHSFPGESSVFNIYRLKSARQEEYAVLTGSSSGTAGFRDCAVWRMVLPDEHDENAENTPPRISRVANIPGGQLCVGMAAASERVLLISDCIAGCIYRLDLETGSTSIYYDDESMRPATRDETLGLGRLEINGDHLFYTNTSRGTLHRLPVQRSQDGQELMPVGPPELVADGFECVAGLAVTSDGRSAYLNSFTMGSLWRVDMDAKTGRGVVHTLRELMPNPTAMELVCGECSLDPTLYVVCCDLVGQEWLNAIQVDKSIVVTSEIRITYEPNPDYIPISNEA